MFKSSSSEKKKKKKNRKLLFDMFSIVLSLDQVSHNRIILLLLYAAHVMKFGMYFQHDIT